MLVFQGLLQGFLIGNGGIAFQVFEYARTCAQLLFDHSDPAVVLEDFNHIAGLNAGLVAQLFGDRNLSLYADLVHGRLSLLKQNSQEYSTVLRNSNSKASAMVAVCKNSVLSLLKTHPLSKSTTSASFRFLVPVPASA